jgi:outer membrane protein assembly factor BamA
VNAAAPIFREILQGNETSSTIGMSMRRDTRDDRFAPTSGTSSGLTLEYAGLGGFANFLRMEARHTWYMGAPDWMLDHSTFVLGTKIGYVIPFNDIDDYNLGLQNVPDCRVEGQCDNVANLDQINDDLTLPLTERYFLGGIGTFQLRGYKARSVGPRRAVLRRTKVVGGGDLFNPVGTQVVTDPVTGFRKAVCRDGPTDFANQGNGNGKCNDLEDRKLSDFDDTDETDVVGGNKFFTSSIEYRFPISEEIGLQGVGFFDMGSVREEDRSLLDTGEWRYGYGGGVLWFSPFGPLQLVLGFPVNPEHFEKSPVFEFSVGGFGL